jgi:hypothetical protein
MPETDVSERNRAVIEHCYNEMWNRWDLAVADEIVSETARFRSSLDSTLLGPESLQLECKDPEGESRQIRYFTLG